MAIALPRTLTHAINQLTNEKVLVGHRYVRDYTTYSTCRWCAEGPDQDAVLVWEWYVDGSVRDDGTVTCINADCVDAALSVALAESDIDHLTVRYPVVIEREAALAA